MTQVWFAQCLRVTLPQLQKKNKKKIKNGQEKTSYLSEKQLQEAIKA